MNIKKILCITLGCIGVGLGALGAVLPLLPAFPFLLLAAFCFGRSSEKLHTWFIGTRLYKDNLESFAQGKGMTKKVKVRIMVPLPSTPIRLPLQRQKLQMSEPVCSQAEARSPRKREYDAPISKNPIILQASILTRKVEEKLFKKFGFSGLQNTALGRKPQNKPQHILMDRKQ